MPSPRDQSERWKPFTDRDLAVIWEGLSEVANNDDPDEEIQRWASDATALADEIEAVQLEREDDD